MENKIEFEPGQPVHVYFVRFGYTENSNIFAVFVNDMLPKRGVHPVNNLHPKKCKYVVDFHTNIPAGAIKFNFDSGADYPAQKGELCNVVEVKRGSDYISKVFKFVEGSPLLKNSQIFVHNGFTTVSNFPTNVPIKDIRCRCSNNDMVDSLIDAVATAYRIPKKYLVPPELEYPVVIHGLDIPKFKANKELMYGKQINFVPFPERNNGAEIRGSEDPESESHYS